MFVHHMRAPLGRRHPDHNKYVVVLGAIKAAAASLDRPCARRPLGVGRGEEMAAGRTKKLKDEKTDRTLGAPP